MTDADLERHVERLGAKVLARRRDGILDIDLDGSQGTSRRRTLRPDVLRTSLVLAWHESRARAEAVIASIAPPVPGWLDVVEMPHGSWATSYTVEVSAASPDALSGLPVAGVAGLLAELARSGPRDGTGGSDVLVELARAGIAPPPGLADLLPRVRESTSWSWGTRTVDPRAMYVRDETTLMALASTGEPELLLCHSGHGANSYALTLALVHGPWFVVTQHAWGGAYGNPRREQLAIATTYANLRAELGDLDEGVRTRPPYLLQLSEYGGRWLFALGHGSAPGGGLSVVQEIELLGMDRDADDADLDAMALSQLRALLGSSVTSSN